MKKIVQWFRNQNELIKERNRNLARIEELERDLKQEHEIFSKVLNEVQKDNIAYAKESRELKREINGLKMDLIQAAENMLVKLGD